MKKLLITSVLAIFALALPGTANAQAKKTPATPAAPAPAKPADPAAPATPDAAPAAPDAAPAAPPAADPKPAPPEKPKTETPKKGVKQGTAGKVTAVDAEKKIITIGRTVYTINDDTQYVNKEAPAALTDVVAGTNVGFSYTADKAGKRTLVKVNVGVKQDAPKTEKADAGEKPAEPAKPKSTTKKKGSS